MNKFYIDKWAFEQLFVKYDSSISRQLNDNFQTFQLKFNQKGVNHPFLFKLLINFNRNILGHEKFGPIL